MHLLGVVCMFIACKYEEIYPFKLSTVYEKIGHKKISQEQIKKKEGEILYSIHHASMSSIIQFTLNGVNNISEEII